jgi:CubicO group peptidase (beta-lactamase class C family)
MKIISLFIIMLMTQFFASGDPDKTESALKLLDNYYNNQQLNGTILIAEKGEILLRRSYGSGEFELKDKIKDNSVFVLASISKSLTSLGILKLIDNGKLSLDDELISFFPELPYNGITIKHLMSNTAGIPEYRPLFAEHWDRSKVAVNSDVIAMMAEHKPPLLFAPGSEFRYSNTGFVFLASVIEKVTGMDYEEYMKIEVFEPLGMKRSLIFTRDKEQDIENFAFPYVRIFLLNPVWQRPETFPAMAFLNYLDGVKGDVSAASCTEDLFNMDMSLLQGKFISNSLLQEAFTPVITDQAGDGYGYGWVAERNSKGEKIIYAEGGMPGISTMNMINMDEERAIIVLSNTRHTRTVEIAKNLERIFEGLEPFEVKVSLALLMAGYIDENGYSEAAEYGKKLAEENKAEVTENDINIAGYEFLQGGNIDAALEYFKLNTMLFPDSWNAFDSLAEGYALKGEKDLAVKFYRKSIQMNPENENGKNALKRLE